MEKNNLTNRIKDGILFIPLLILGVVYAIAKLFEKKRSESNAEEIIRLKRERSELHDKIEEQQKRREQNEKQYKESIKDIEENDDPSNVVDFFDRRYGSDDNGDS